MARAIPRCPAARDIGAMRIAKYLMGAFMLLVLIMLYLSATAPPKLVD